MKKILIIISILLNIYFIGTHIHYIIDTMSACSSNNKEYGLPSYDWEYGFILSGCKYEYKSLPPRLRT